MRKTLLTWLATLGLLALSIAPSPAADGTNVLLRAGAVSPFAGFNGIFAGLGDSYIANAQAFGTNLVQWNDAGSTWAYGNAFGNGLLTTPTNAFQGHFGDVIGSGGVGISGRVGATNAADPAVVLFDGGLNDVLSGVAASTSFANLQAILSSLNSPHIIVATIPLTYAPTAPTAPQNTQRLILNTDIATLASNRVKILDVAALLPDSSYFGTDGEHPNNKGSLTVGHSEGSILIAIGSATGDVSAFIAANALGSGANPTMSGAGGGLTNATGLVATGWGLTGVAASFSTVGSKDATTGDQIITTSGTYTGSGGSAILNINQFPSVNLAAGQVIEQICVFKIISNYANLSNIVVFNQLFRSDFGAIYAEQLGWTASGAQSYTTADGWIYYRSPQLTVGTGAGGAFLSNVVQITLKDGTGLSASGAIQIHRCGTRLVK